MNADNFVLPEYWDISRSCEAMNPLEEFIYNNEPVDGDEDFRKELEDAIKFVLRKAQEK